MEHVARVPNGCTVVSTVGIDPLDVFKTRVRLENKYKPKNLGSIAESLTSLFKNKVK
jgi:hypothetical protein